MFKDIVIDITSAIISMFVFLTFISIIYSRNNKSDTSNNKIVFKFTRHFILLPFLSGILMTVLLVSSLALDSDSRVIALLVFGPVVLFLGVIYSYLKLKVIKYENETFYVKGFLKKSAEYKMSDVESAYLKPENKVVIRLRNQKKFSIDVQMENYDLLKDLLKDNNIIIK